MIIDFLEDFTIEENITLFDDYKNKSFKKIKSIENIEINYYINEFWTSKQRQGNSLHEISYRACFKPQLPNFFITKLTKELDVVYDPFLGRGTTLIEAALLNRNIAGNDINPLSKIFCESRLLIPDINKLKQYLSEIPIYKGLKADIDLSMFYHKDTESEIVSLKNFFLEKEEKKDINDLDKWIRMVATNRLTGHSKNFFSVFTMPPNQAVSPERQIIINQKYNQIPEYRDVKKIIYNKSLTLIKDISNEIKYNLKNIHKNAIFSNVDARYTRNIPDNYVTLTVTSPPFLDIVQYDEDNWLRCWFNNINLNEISKKITMTRNINEWSLVMQDVFKELYRITKNLGYVAFEVGEVKGGKINLEEYVLPLGLKAGFKPLAVIINQQKFTKTANIWGVSNNNKGTNSNRIVLFQKL